MQGDKRLLLYGIIAIILFALMWLGRAEVIFKFNEQVVVISEDSEAPFGSRTIPIFMRPDTTLASYPSAVNNLILGADSRGRDLFTRLLYMLSEYLNVWNIIWLIVIPIVGGAMIAVLMEIYKGFRSSFEKIFLNPIGAMPKIVAIFFLISFFNAPEYNIFIIASSLGFMNIPEIVRAIRKRMESVVTTYETFVTANYAMGLSKWRIYFRHILLIYCRPTVFALVMSLLTQFIITETSLGFIGRSTANLSLGNYLNEEISKAELVISVFAESKGSSKIRSEWGYSGGIIFVNDTASDEFYEDIGGKNRSIFWKTLIVMYPSIVITMFIVLLVLYFDRFGNSIKEILES